MTPALFKQSEVNEWLVTFPMLNFDRGKSNFKILFFWKSFWSIWQKPHYPSSQQSCNPWSTFFVDNTTQEHRSALKSYTQSKDPNTLTVRQ